MPLTPPSEMPSDDPRRHLLNGINQYGQGVDPEILKYPDLFWRRIMSAVSERRMRELNPNRVIGLRLKYLREQRGFNRSEAVARANHALHLIGDYGISDQYALYRMEIAPQQQVIPYLVGCGLCMAYGVPVDSISPWAYPPHEFIHPDLHTSGNIDPEDLEYEA